MKKQILMMVSLVWALSSMGQQADSTVYQSVFGDSVARWYETRCVGCAQVYDVFTDDTVRIDGLLYRKARRVDFDGNICEYSPQNEWPKLLFRESASHGKLFFRKINYGQPTADTVPEKVIMDLDMSIGDTLDAGINGYIPSIIDGYIPPIIVDSVYYKDGRKILRTSYHLEQRVAATEQKDTLFLIEGVGPSFGIVYTQHYGCSTPLVCYYRDTTFEYHDEKYYYYGMGGPELCEIWFYDDGIDDNPQQISPLLTMVPNPTNDIVNLKFSVSGKYNIKIVESNGRCILEESLQGDKYEINVKEFPKGVYFVIIEGDNNCELKKMIKI